MARLRAVALVALVGACSVFNVPGEEKPQIAGDAGSGASSGTETTAGSHSGGDPGSPHGGMSAAGRSAAGDGPCEGADCMTGGAGGMPDEPVHVCVPDEPLCHDDVATICNGDGTGYVGGTKCTSKQTCVVGACEDHQCEPDAAFCSAGVRRKCSTDGLSSTEVEVCGAGKYCDEASDSCKTGTCAPGLPACDGTRATTCNAEGSGYSAGGKVCDAQTTCDSGNCQPHVCTPKGKVCSGKDVVTCADNGLSSAVTQTCTASQYCDDATVTCKAQVCSPGVPMCSGNSVKTCNSKGSGTTSLDCNNTQYCDGTTFTCKAQVCTPSAKSCQGNNVVTCNATGSGTSSAACTSPNPLCVGAGVCGVCTPNDLKCSGQQPQKCGATGQWANNGTACSGALVCDVNGSFTCTKSPTVVGGTVAISPYGPSKVSTFRLDRFETTVAEFRLFVAAVAAGWNPPNGGGKHTHLNAGNGLQVRTTGTYEPGWSAAAGDQFPLHTVAEWNTALACDPVNATWTATAGANENKPINCLDLSSAKAYCIWNGGFLPSDAEWVYAASADGTGVGSRLYPWGPNAPLANANLAIWGCYYGSAGGVCSAGSIAPVGSALMGNSFYGQSDLIGNVEEWVLDSGIEPSPPRCVDCVGQNDATLGMTKGGWFSNTDPAYLLSTNREPFSRTDRYILSGVRCARVP